MIVKSDSRNFIIISKHKRLTRLWQFFFTGWGLVMVAVLVAASLFTKQILWTPITAVDMKDMANNQFKMTNANFVGVDKDNNPFEIHAISGKKRYNKPDIIFLEKPSGKVQRKTDKGVVTDTFSAKQGNYNHKEKVLLLKGNVLIESDNGDKASGQEIEVQL